MAAVPTGAPGPAPHLVEGTSQEAHSSSILAERAVSGEGKLSPAARLIIKGPTTALVVYPAKRGKVAREC